MPDHAATLGHTARRIAGVLIVVTLAILIVRSDALHGLLEDLLRWADPVLGRRTVGSAAVIVLFAAASAMLAFVSSAVVVPVAVHVWGGPMAMVLLWAGWLLGGLSAFGLGYGVGRPLARRIVGPKRMAYFEERVGAKAPFSAILLLQLALPSEIPGYALGALRYSLPRYLAALALVELPYAAATVWLGDALLRRRIVPLVAAGAVAAAVALVTWRYLKRRPATGARTD